MTMQTPTAGGTKTDTMTIKVNERLSATVLEISALGVQLELPGPLRPAASCSLILPTSCGPLRLRARILRCEAVSIAREGGDSRLTFRAALEFIDLDDQQTRTLVSTCGAAPVDAQISRDKRARRSVA